MKKSAFLHNLIPFLIFFLSVSTSGIVYSEQTIRKPIEVGEPLSYSIYKLLFKVGEVDLAYKGPTELNGRDVLRITFKAKGLNFSDHDEIYLDPETFLPLQVSRDVSIFGKHEEIIEYYFPDEGKVKIVKTVKGKIEEQVIEKDGPLDNIYGFIYNFRMKNTLKVGEKVSIQLPTKDVIMMYVDQRDFSWRGEKRRVAYLESKPKQFRIWFDVEHEMLPLRIDGAVGFGKTSMILKDSSLF